jgi:hypothetical protein
MRIPVAMALFSSIRRVIFLRGQDSAGRKQKQQGHVSVTSSDMAAALEALGRIKEKRRDFIGFTPDGN